MAERRTSTGSTTTSHSSHTKYWTRKDVKRISRDSGRKLVIIYHYVLDLTDFLHRHPGGPEVLRDVVGKDGTMNFDGVGHSRKAKDWMKKFVIGKLHHDERVDS